jgi:S-adenosylmethionine/arginine decarboxylase-like enzyme
MTSYGKELILDLHECDSSTFNRKMLRRYFTELCKLIDMKRAKLTWWDDYNVPLEDRQSAPHLKGTSAVQFILTSNITIHTLDLLSAVYVNLFSCKDFDAEIVKEFSAKWFKGKIVSSHEINRV